MAGGATKRRSSYPKIYRATIVNPSEFNEKQLTFGVGSDIISSMSFWPENYALQIDVITLPLSEPRDKNYDSNKYVHIFFSLKSRKSNGKAPEPFENWANDLYDLLGDYMCFEPITLKDYNHMMSYMQAHETYELVPYCEAAHFTPGDFDELLEQKQANANKSKDNSLDGLIDALNDAAEPGWTNVEYFIQNNNNSNQNAPFPMLGGGRELFKKMLYNPGSHLRTIIAPADEQVVSDIREESSDYYNGAMGTSFPVVNIRTTFSHIYEVPFDIKRVLSSLARDSVLTKLLHSEDEKLISTPIDAVESSPRNVLTASAFTRIPIFDKNSPYFTSFNSASDNKDSWQPDFKSEELKLLQNLIRDELRSELKEMLPIMHEAMTKDVIDAILQRIENSDKEPNKNYSEVGIDNNMSNTAPPLIQSNIDELSEMNSERNIG